MVVKRNHMLMITEARKKVIDNAFRGKNKCTRFTINLINCVIINN